MVCLLLLPALSFAEGQILQGNTIFSNALFIALLAIIIFLLIVAMALTKVLKNLAKSDLLLKLKEKNDKTDNTLKATGLLLFCLTGFSASAASGGDAKWLVGGLEMSTFLFMIAMIAMELIFIASLFRTLKSLLKDPSVKTQAVPVKKEKTILEKLNASVEIENEAEIMMGHEYDGIRELDNDLPPWWRYGFYLTIVVSVIYLIHFHIAGTGDLQLTEYNKEVAQGKAEVEEYMKTQADNVDETTVKLLGETDIETGKTLFISTCAACHGRLGEGGVGPNLTDDYWMHGGSLADIFKSIKYGWPDKGMKSWKEDISPMQISQITSFIKKIQGTNPPNAKAQQGDLFVENTNAPADTLKKEPVTDLAPAPIK
ncbi:MAG: hypothetical protein K0S12_478 [Bacteroidetes bacterium]|nr:hypothetical protein [Bacteroidota bacterium]